MHDESPYEYLEDSAYNFGDFSRTLAMGKKASPNAEWHQSLWKVYELAKQHGYKKLVKQESGDTQWWLYLADGKAWTEAVPYGAWKCYPPGDFRNGIIAGYGVLSMNDLTADPPVLLNRLGYEPESRWDFIRAKAEEVMGSGQIRWYDSISLGYHNFPALGFEDGKFTVSMYNVDWEREQVFPVGGWPEVRELADAVVFAGCTGMSMIAGDLVAFPEMDGQNIVGFTPLSNLVHSHTRDDHLQDAFKDENLVIWLEPGFIVDLFVLSRRGFDGVEDYNLQVEELNKNHMGAGYKPPGHAGPAQWHYSDSMATIRFADGVHLVIQDAYTADELGKKARESEDDESTD